MVDFWDIVWVLTGVALLVLFVLAIAALVTRWGRPGQGQALAGLVLVALLLVAFGGWSIRYYELRGTAPAAGVGIGPAPAPGLADPRTPP